MVGDGLCALCVSDGEWTFCCLFSFFDGHSLILFTPLFARDTRAAAMQYTKHRRPILAGDGHGHGRSSDRRASGP